jgi:hypothetical protein
VEEKKMFGKNKMEIPKSQTKEQQLGPKPEDMPFTHPLITFQVILKNNLPSVEVQAHAHDFGEETNCDRPRSGQWTKFVVYGDTTWTEHHEYVDSVRGPMGMQSVRRWRWVKHQPHRVVFSIRTADVSMVAATDNAKAVEVETLALERRETPQPCIESPYKYADGGVISRESIRNVDLD